MNTSANTRGAPRTRFNTDSRRSSVWWRFVGRNGTRTISKWDEDYFKAAPFAVRLNGEDFGTFATLDKARKCFDNVEQLYNSL